MSYAAKFVSTSEEYRGTRVVCPAVVEPDLAREISRIALRSFRALGGWGYGRVDIRLDGDGKPCVLEVNCNPDLEEGVALARSAAKAGISYSALLQMIVEAALEYRPFEVEVPMMPPLHGPATLL
jgi:D-alanine-D-alanine ligase